MIDWDDYRFFLTVARASSVRDAALQLGCSHSTVLRRLERLEQGLGARLFDRTAQGYRLTEAGDDVLTGAGELEDSVQSIERMATGRDSALSGPVRISMPDLGFALLAEIQQLKNTFPGIQPIIDLSYDAADLNKREADIAIRLTSNPPEDLVGRKIGVLEHAVYANHVYVEQYKPHEKDSKAQWIGWGNPQKWLVNSPFPHLSVYGIFDDMNLQLACVNAQMGIGMLPCFIGEKEEQLQRLTEPKKVCEVWILYHRDLRSTARVRMVRDHLVQALRKYFIHYTE